MFEIMKGIIEASHRKYIFIREMYRKMYNARLSMNSNAVNSCMSRQYVLLIMHKTEQHYHSIPFLALCALS